LNESPDATQPLDPAHARLVDEVIEEMTAWSPAERIRTFRSWMRGSLSLIHLHVLTVLEADGPQPMSRLAEALDVSVASATGIVDRMEERGLVERRPSTVDRRVVEVHRTEAGVAVFQGLREERRARLRALIGTLSAAELRALLTGLRALHRARSERTDAGAAHARPTDPHA